MAPSLSMLKNAFFNSSGSKVHSIKSTPAAMAYFRCSSFKRRPKTSVAVWRQDTEHVTMQILLPACLQTRYAQAKCNHFSAVEGAEDLATNFAGNNE